jgi:hypothetical protein
MKRVILHISFCLVFVSSVAYAQEALTDRLKKHVYTLAADSLMGRSAGSVFAAKAAAYIERQWEEIGLTPLVGESFLVPFENRYYNLVAIIEGNDPLLKNEYIVVGAHYDHLGNKTAQNGETIIYNGADDNASGTATVIELGRQLKVIQPTLARSVILIAFDAEEIGLYGSNEFANNPPVPINDVKLMLSVDMVGWYKTSGYLMLSGYGTINNGKQLFQNSNLIPEGLHLKTQNFEKSLFTATDTYGFASKGIPTLAVTTGLKSPYHKPEDMAELIDYDGMALITEYLTNLIQAVSTDESYRPSGKIAAKHRPPSKFEIAIAANIGSNHHYYTAGAVNAKTAGAYGIGLTAGINMGFWGLRPEVYYDYLKARHPAGNISTHSITVPLNILLQTPSSSSMGAAIFVGPYYRHFFSGKQQDTSLEFDNHFYRNEGGINYGVEVRVAMIRIGLTNRQAFTNFTRTKNEDGAYLRNRSIFATIGYIF